MKKAIVPALALFLIGTAANAQLKETPKAATTASSKTVVRKPAATSTASVSPKKTTTPVTATKTKTVTKSTGIKRKHPRKAKKSKAKAKKM